MANTVDETAGSKYNLNASCIDFSQGVRVLGLYMNSNSNLIIGTPPFLYSKKDFIQFFTMMEISGSLIEDTPGNWLFSSPNDLTSRAVTYFMLLEYAGNTLQITADGVAPTVSGSVSVYNFVNNAVLAAHPGFGLNIKVMIDQSVLFNGPMPSSVTDNNTFLTWLNATYGNLGAWTKTYTNYQTAYVLSSTGNHNVVIQLGSQAAALLTVNIQTAQIITFGTLPAKTFGGSTYALATTTSSGLPISYSSDNTGVISISGNIATIVGAGTANITASQAGNTDYTAATPVIQAQVVNKANQTITFGALTTIPHTNAPFGLTGTASSGLTVTYVSGTPGVATVAGSTLTPVSAGSAVITASQAGNANYNAATPVPETQTLS